MHSSLCPAAKCGVKSRHSHISQTPTYTHIHTRFHAHHIMLVGLCTLGETVSQEIPIDTIYRDINFGRVQGKKSEDYNRVNILEFTGKNLCHLEYPEYQNTWKAEIKFQEMYNLAIIIKVSVMILFFNTKNYTINFKYLLKLKY